ncbi:MAG: PAS domain S-box protein [Chloroflexi bacterium]|nr:PAS domain S-box protein [Chloroflexota bacterium]
MKGNKPKGKPAGLISSRDSTRQKKAEEALRQSEERYRTILEDIKEGYWETDPAGNFTFFNDAVCHLLGYSKKKMMGMNYRAYIIAEDVDKVYKAFNQVYRTDKPIENMLYKTIRKDRSERFAETSVFPRRNDTGEIIGFRGVTRDVTERKEMEKALRESEEKFRIAAASVSDLVWDWDIVEGKLDWFGNIDEMLGYAPGEFPRTIDAWEKAIHPDDHDRVMAVLDLHLTTRTPYFEEYRVIRKDGSIRYWIDRGAAFWDEKGNAHRMFGACSDISERKQAEEALRQSEKRYRTVLEDMEESYYEIDLAGNFTFFNDALCRRLGYSREELTGINYRVFTPPENVKKVLETYNRVYRTGKPVKSFPVERIRKDGTRIFAESSVFSLQNERGEIIGFRGLSRDVTERLQMIEALRRSGERYRTILEEMQDGYFEVDLTGNFTFFNDALCRGLGYSREELMGMNYRVYIPPEHVKKVFKTYNRVYRTGDITKWFPIDQIRKDGTRVSTEDSIWPLRNERGDIIGFRGISRDVTERKQAELERRQIEQKAQLASRLASVGELASGIAHEINNPLTGVIGYAHLLLDRKDISQDIRHDLEIINEGAQRVAAIIRKLLTFARQQKPEQRFANINEIISTTLDLRAYELASNSIRVAFQPARDLPMTIVDSGQLQQVFLNLIINAETAMKLTKGGGKLSIKTEQVDNTILISFKDNGPGIAKENLERIFDPFFTTREVGQGTGLGLNVCHGIITEHKGRIWVKSKLGRGATFIVELPIVTEDSQLVLLEPTVEEPKKVTKAKILVIDDEPVIRQFVSRVLSEEGHEVEAVDKAEDALEKIKSKRYRLILLDIKMPGISSIELYKQFQEIAPSLMKRVVFITGDVLGKRTTDFLAKTKAPYIMKPFDAEQLKTEINRILARG